MKDSHNVSFSRGRSFFKKTKTQKTHKPKSGNLRREKYKTVSEKHNTYNGDAFSTHTHTHTYAHAPLHALFIKAYWGSHLPTPLIGH